MAKSIERHLAEQELAGEWHEAMLDWAEEKGLDPEDPETEKAFELDVEEAAEAWLEGKAELEMDR